MSSKLKIVHVITDLGQGGAEGVLYRLVKATCDDWSHIVVSLVGDGIYGPLLREVGIPVYTLNKPRGRLTLKGLIALRKMLRAERPDVVQTWMYHADLVGGVVARIAGIRGIAWGIRHSELTPTSSRSARWCARICSRLSHWVPVSIVCCSRQATMIHRGYGYAPEKFVLIQNGFDLSKFVIDRQAGRSLRASLGIFMQGPVIGMIARWDPQKDHRNLLLALRSIRHRYPNLRCLLVGSGVTLGNGELASLLHEHDLSDVVIALGPRSDLSDLMNAIDVFVLSSAYGEAFPNVLAEAMACGTACVATDVGDSREIVGEHGWIVPPRDSDALAHAIGLAIEAEQSAREEHIRSLRRSHIEGRFSLEQMALEYKTLWSEISTKFGRGSGP